MICCEKLWRSISREWLVRPIRACWTLVPILCQSHRQIWMSPNVTGQNHLPWTCSVPRISHALSHQTVRFTTTHSLSFPTSFTSPCAHFVPSTKHLFSTPSLSTPFSLFMFLLSSFCLLSLFRTLKEEYERLSPPNYSYCPWSMFSPKMAGSLIQGREEPTSACFWNTRTSLSVWSPPLTFLIAAS